MALFRIAAIQDSESYIFKTMYLLCCISMFLQNSGSKVYTAIAGTSTETSVPPKSHCYLWRGWFGNVFFGWQHRCLVSGGQGSVISCSVESHRKNTVQHPTWLSNVHSCSWKIWLSVARTWFLSTCRHKAQFCLALKSTEVTKYAVKM